MGQLCFLFNVVYAAVACDELVVRGAAVFSLYSCLLLLVIDTEINCSYEFCAEDLPPGCRFGLPFCFIVEAHRVGFPFLVVFLQLNGIIVFVGRVLVFDVGCLSCCLLQLNGLIVFVGRVLLFDVGFLVLLFPTVERFNCFDWRALVFVGRALV